MGIYSILEGLEDVRVYKKSFDKVKYREDWSDMQSLQKDEIEIPTKYLSIDSGIYGKKDADFFEEGLLNELQEILKRKKTRSLSEIEGIIKRFTHETFTVIEMSNLRLLLKSSRNAKRLLEVRYGKKLKKVIDAETGEVKVLPQGVEEKLPESVLKEKALRHLEGDKKRINKAKKNVVESLSIVPKPMKEQPVELDKIQKEANCSIEDAQKAAEASKRLFTTSNEIEPKITNDLLSVVKQLGGKMYGLDFRLKQPTSLGRKIACDAIEFGGDLEKAVNNIKDAIRYTVVYPIKTFTRNYMDTRAMLEAQGYIEVRCKNFYLKYAQGKSQQKAIQCVYRNPDGVSFELQFHTIESQGIKELNHPMYEGFRDKSKSDNEKGVLNYRMINLSNNVEDPEGVMEIEEHG